VLVEQKNSFYVCRTNQNYKPEKTFHAKTTKAGAKNIHTRNPKKWWGEQNMI
jgi:hypothetical protein